MSSGLVCIGGSCDGLRIEGKGDTLVMVKLDKNKIVQVGTLLEEYAPLEQDIYTRQDITVPGKKVSVWKHSSITDNGVLMMLVDKYEDSKGDDSK